MAALLPLGRFEVRLGRKNELIFLPLKITGRDVRLVAFYNEQISLGFSIRYEILGLERWRETYVSVHLGFFYFSCDGFLLTKLQIIRLVMKSSEYLKEY